MDQHFNIHDVPVSLRIGSVGAGLGVGCGIGVGFGKPLNLAAVPAAGQAIAGMSSGLGQISGFLGGAGTGIREIVRNVGVKGLDAGLGCGVGIGYGFGAGLFLKPTAAEQLLRQVQGTAGDMARFAQAKLQDVGLRFPGAQLLLPAQSSSRTQPSCWDTAAPSSHPPLQQTLLPPHEGAQVPPGDILDERVSDRAIGSPQPHSSHLSGFSSAGPGAPFSPSAWQQGSHPYSPQQLQPQWQESSRPAQPQPSGVATGDRLPNASHGAASCLPLHTPTSYAAQPLPSRATTHAVVSAGPVPEPSAEEFRALLRHEREIARLRVQNRALRGAVCQLNRRLPICKQEEKDDEDDGRTGIW